MRRETPRVVHLSALHPPHDNRILFKECRALVDAGMEVYFVVPADASEVVGGVQIVPVPKPASMTSRNLVTDFQVWRAASRLEPHVYHFHDTELGRVGLMLARAGRRVIRDVHENPDDRMRWAPEWARPALHGASIKLQKRAAPHYAATIAATPRIAAFFPAESTYLIRNCPRAADWPDLPYHERKPEIVYAGVIAEHRCAFQMLDALTHIDKSLGARLVWAGAIHPSGLEATLRREPGWGLTEYLGYLDAPVLPAMLSRGRVGLCLAARDAPNVQHEAYSTKFYEYMLAGLPLVVADYPSWRDRLGPIGCALFADPDRPVEIARAVETLLRDPNRAREMGERGRAAVVAEKYTWESESARLVEIYERVLGGTPSVASTA